MTQLSEGSFKYVHLHWKIFYFHNDSLCLVNLTFTAYYHIIVFLQRLSNSIFIFTASHVTRLSSIWRGISLLVFSTSNIFLFISVNFLLHVSRNKDLQKFGNNIILTWSCSPPNSQYSTLLCGFALIGIQNFQITSFSKCFVM